MTAPTSQTTIVSSAKRGVKRTFRMMTARIRLMPDFIIIGAQRSGTTSLYNYLTRHPSIAPAYKKEVHFFDINFGKGISWYRAQFPSSLYKYLNKTYRRDLITGEASPYYLFHPHVPKRVAQITPQVKLIALLRNPIDRAYSHYHHEVKMGVEPLSFEEAIEREQERTASEMEQILRDENHCSFNHQHFSYLARGIYIDQLQHWMNYFPREQILIIQTESFYRDPPSALRQITRFVNLPAWELDEYKQYNAVPYSKMDSALRRTLVEYFKPHNRRLYDLLGVDLGWDS